MFTIQSVNLGLNRCYGECLANSPAPYGSGEVVICGEIESVTNVDDNEAWRQHI